MRTVRGIVKTGTLDSAIGDYAFISNSPAGKAILNRCKQDDLCEVEAVIERDLITSVTKATKVAPEAYVGAWSEDGQGCSEKIEPEKLQPSEFIFDGAKRYHFEGSCSIVRSKEVGLSSFELDEECSNGGRTTKMHWSLSVAGDAMTAAITRPGRKREAPFHLKRCSK